MTTTTLGVAQETECISHEDRERIQEIMLQAIDQGVKQQALKMFEIWLKDPTDQPERARRGMEVGIRAYIKSRAVVLRWSPRSC